MRIDLPRMYHACAMIGLTTLLLREVTQLVESVHEAWGSANSAMPGDSKRYAARADDAMLAILGRLHQPSCNASRRHTSID